MQAASTQRLIDHRGAATAALAIGIFVSGLALGATLVTNGGLVSNGASVHSAAFDPNAVSLQQHRKFETSLGASNRAASPSFDIARYVHSAASPSFDSAHHLRQAAPPSLQSDAAIKVVRDHRQGEFGVGGP